MTWCFSRVALIAVIVSIGVVLLGGCSVSEKLLDTQKVYKRTLRFRVNGEAAEGVYSAKKNSSYRLDLALPGKPNILKMTTCHRERIYLRPGKELSLDYRPSHVEASAPCAMEISALEDGGTKNQWGMIDFKLDEETLPALVHCNGEQTRAVGSQVCQSRVGLLQAIEFAQPVSALAAEGCGKMEGDTTPGRFSFAMPKEACFFLFADGAGRLFRLVTFGYDEVLLDD